MSNPTRPTPRPYQLAAMAVLLDLDPETATIAAAITALDTSLPYTCPQCSGEGTIDELQGAADDVTVQVECPLCNGMGKTDPQYEAVTKVVGYQVVPDEG